MMVNPEHKLGGDNTLTLFMTNEKTGKDTLILWEPGETFREACKRAGLPALIVINDKFDDQL